MNQNQTISDSLAETRPNRHPVDELADIRAEGRLRDLREAELRAVLLADNKPRPGSRAKNGTVRIRTGAEGN